MNNWIKKITTFSRIFGLAAVIILLISGPCLSGQITDHEGTTHRFPEPYKRIISLYPAHTENLIEMGGADVLIGISSSDTISKDIIDRERFSYHDSAEKFIAAAPDCILIRPMISHSTPNLIKKLKAYGIAVISLQPTSPDQLYSYWRLLGKLSGHASQAELMTERFQQKLNDLRQVVDSVPKHERPLVYFESIHARMKTFSPDSITIFCLINGGGRNAAIDAVSRRGTNIAGYGKERIIARADSIDVYLAQSGRMNRISVDEILSEPGFGALQAVRNKRVYLVSENLVSRPTSKLIDGMLLIHAILYQPSLL